jgi:hypothetical protein
VFRKLDLFPSAGEGREISTLLGPLERANLIHWARIDIYIPSPDDRSRSSFLSVVFWFSEYRTMNEVQKTQSFHTEFSKKTFP